MKWHRARVGFVTVLAVWLSTSGRLPPVLGAVPYPGGVAVVSNVFDPTSPTNSNPAVAYHNPSLLQNAANSVWSNAVQQNAAYSFQQYFGGGNLIASGITLNNVVCNLTQTGTLYATPSDGLDTGKSGPHGNSLTLQYVLPKNSLDFFCTTATPQPGSSNPEFSCTFDIAFNIVIQLPATLRANFVRSSSATVYNVKFDTHHAAAGVLQTFDSVVTFFQGPAFLTQAGACLNRSADSAMTSYLNAGVGLPWDFIAGPYVQAGYSKLTWQWIGSAAQMSTLRGLPNLPSPPFLLAFLERDIPISNDRPGWVSGVIRWNASLGQPISHNAGMKTTPKPGSHGGSTSGSQADWGDAFTIRAYAQSDFREPTGRMPTATLGVVQERSYVGESNGQYIVSYRLGSLPLNVPLWLQIFDSAQLRWQGQAATAFHVFQADGWGGKITLRPGPAPPPRRPGSGLPIPPPAGNNPAADVGVLGINFRMSLRAP
jgi:hypothetical protein